MSTTDASNVAAAGNTMSSVMGLVSTVKDKWDSSGGNEMVSRVSSSIPQGTKDYISTAGQKLFARKHLRSFTVFFGIGEERAFYVERSPSLLMARLQHNLSFFYLNYMLIFGVLFVLTMLTSVRTMFYLSLLAVAWVYVVRVSQDGGLKIYGLTISAKHATIGMGAISVMVLMSILANIFWWTVGSGGFLIGVHSFLRDASMHQDQEDQVEMSGDLSLVVC